MSQEQRSAERIRKAYARRERLGLDSRYETSQPANRFMFQSRERDLLRVLQESGGLPIAGRRVLDAGCGDGSVLQDFERLGAQGPDLFGVDLLASRLNGSGRTVGVAVADAGRLPISGQSFELVLAFTLLSSIQSARALANVALELMRVTKPGGMILIYEFWTNPLNRDVTAVKRARLRRLFGGKEVEFHASTLAPPLVRILAKLPGGLSVCRQLEVLPFLKTHYFAVIHC